MSCVVDCCYAFFNWMRCRGCNVYRTSPSTERYLKEIELRVAASAERAKQQREEMRLQFEQLYAMATIAPERVLRRSEPQKQAVVERDHPLVYSRKGLTVSEKLEKQLHHALKDPEGCKKPPEDPFRFWKYDLEPEKYEKPEEPRFEVDLPAELAEKWERRGRSLVDGVAQHEGTRPYQEDRYLSKQQVLFWKNGKIDCATLFGIFDGHGDHGKAGNHLERHLGRTLETFLTKHLENSDLDTEEVIPNAFTFAFNKLGESYREGGGENGATATCAFVYKNKIYLANVGDSRIILVKKKETYQLTEDAAVTNPRFQTWHRKAGNLIRGDSVSHPDPEIRNGFRLARDVGVSWMCCRPKITRIFVDQKEDLLHKGEIYCGEGDYLVLASDGLSRKAVVNEVGQAVRKLAEAGASPECIATQITNKAGEGLSDNVTVMVIAI